MRRKMVQAEMMGTTWCQKALDAFWGFELCETSRLGSLRWICIQDSRASPPCWTPRVRLLARLLCPVVSLVAAYIQHHTLLALSLPAFWQLQAQSFPYCPFLSVGQRSFRHLYQRLAATFAPKRLLVFAYFKQHGLYIFKDNLAHVH